MSFIQYGKKYLPLLLIPTLMSCNINYKALKNESVSIRVKKDNMDMFLYKSNDDSTYQPERLKIDHKGKKWDVIFDSKKGLKIKYQ